MSTDMIERVARAINPYAWLNVWPESQFAQRDELRGRAMYAARAAIEALRNPTMEMMIAAREHHEGAAYLPHSLFNSMIDAILSEPKP